jgi:hypothetical protein
MNHGVQQKLSLIVQEQHLEVKVLTIHTGNIAHGIKHT